MLKQKINSFVFVIIVVGEDNLIIKSTVILIILKNNLISRYKGGI